MDSSQNLAVITGAASGIGLALAEVCSKNGLNLVMADLASEALHTQVELLKSKTKVEILAVVIDVTKPKDLEFLAEKTFKHFNRVDYLFNNAGISGPLAPIWDLKPEQIKKVMDVNLYGAIYGIQAFLPKMFAQNHRSHLINISSLYGLCSGSLMSAYAMSKQALIALSESLYFDLKRLDKPVDVSVVCPSFANTNLVTNSFPSTENNMQQMMADLLARSRPAMDVAEYIFKEVKAKTFYILPDKEVKDYFENRSKAIIEQREPHLHSIEKIIAKLAKRLELIS